MLSIISFFSFNLEFTNVKKLRAVTFDEFLFITGNSYHNDKNQKVSN